MREWLRLHEFCGWRCTSPLKPAFLVTLWGCAESSRQGVHENNGCSQWTGRDCTVSLSYSCLGRRESAVDKCRQTRTDRHVQTDTCRQTGKPCSLRRWQTCGRDWHSERFSKTWPEGRPAEWRGNPLMYPDCWNSKINVVQPDLYVTLDLWTIWLTNTRLEWSVAECWRIYSRGKQSALRTFRKQW